MFDIATYGLTPLASRCTSPNFMDVFLPMLPSERQLISIRRQVFVFLSLRQTSGRLAFIFRAAGMVVSHIIVMLFVSTSLSGFTCQRRKPRAGNNVRQSAVCRTKFVFSRTNMICSVKLAGHLSCKARRYLAFTFITMVMFCHIFCS